MKRLQFMNVLIFLGLSACSKQSGSSVDSFTHSNQYPKTNAISFGVFSCLPMQAALKKYTKNTTYLEYFSLDNDKSVEYLPTKLLEHTNQIHASQRKLRLQLAVELQKTSLIDFIKELEKPGSKLLYNIHVLANTLKETNNVDAFIRPLSEMNDENLSDKPSWKLNPYANDSGNSPKNFAKAWTLFTRALRNEGLTQIEFHFNPLVAINVGTNPLDEGNIELTFEALNLIQPGDVHALGLNVYSRPIGAPWAPSKVDLEKYPVGELDSPYTSVSALSERWISKLKKSKHAGINLVVGEMGASNQGTDENKLKWIREAFEYVRQKQFSMLTYFDCKNFNWATLSGSLAENELLEQLAR